MVGAAVSELDRGQVLAARRDPFHRGVCLLAGKEGVEEYGVPLAVDRCRSTLLRRMQPPAAG
jgi:hypothetical protein